jgi:hypothetical protein
VTTHEHDRLSTEDLLNASPGSREHDMDHDELDDRTQDDMRADDLDNEGDNEGLSGRDQTDNTRLDTDLAQDEELAPDGGITSGHAAEANTTADNTEDTTTADTGDQGSPADEITTGQPVTNGKPVSTQNGDEAVPLFATTEVEQFRTQWKEIQSTFVDSPQDAVREADELVAEIMQNLAATFAEHKSTLEGQWSRGDEVQTEDLRLALRQYRTFFNQLLSV